MDDALIFLFISSEPLISFIKWIMGPYPKPNANIFVDKIGGAIAHANTYLEDFELLISRWTYQFCS